MLLTGMLKRGHLRRSVAVSPLPRELARKMGESAWRG
jgi:hypothetical protein